MLSVIFAVYTLNVYDTGRKEYKLHLNLCTDWHGSNLNILGCLGGIDSDPGIEDEQTINFS